MLVEWPETAQAPTDYWLSTLPADTPIEELVRLGKIRWRIEHDYRELKHGLGLDHFEGRHWLGWHHHTTLVTAAHLFVTMKRLVDDPKPGRRAEFLRRPRRTSDCRHCPVRSLPVLPPTHRHLTKHY